MAKKNKRKPVTPGSRFTNLIKTDTCNVRPEKSLTEKKHNAKGRNAYGRITSRRRGGGHKRLYRKIDFKRNKFEIEAKVQSIEYDPNRSANIALIAYLDGEKRYILAPNGLKVGDKVLSTNNKVEDYEIGLSLPLKHIPPATTIHAVELEPGRGAQMARSAGTSVQIIGLEKGNAQIKLPSGEIRLVNENCRATIGEVSNKAHNRRSLGKAGRNRWLGRRPRVRGVAMNPHDHPMGGGEGRTSGGGPSESPTNVLSKGYKTRRKKKPSNKMIMVRRNGNILNKK